MADQVAFDPYRKWLGIPANELPPTHYRLLGVVEFESDPDVISNAADRCMAHVRTYQSGAHGELSQKILNELSLARNCLLTPAARAQYDQQLRARHVASPPAVTQARRISPMDPVSVAGTSVAPRGALPVATAVPARAGVLDGPDLGNVSKRTRVSRRVRKKSSPLPALVTIAVIMLAVVIVVVMMYNPTANQPRRKTAKPKPPTQTPRTIIIKHHLSDSDGGNRVLTPQNENEERGGGAPVVDVRSSTNNRKRRRREEPTSAEHAIELARLALGMSNPARAGRLLKEADQFSPSAEQRATIEHLGKLRDYLTTFSRALSAGVEKLEPGRNFLIDIGNRQVPVTFKEFERQNGRRLVFDIEGQRKIYRLDDLPADWALPIVRGEIDANSPASRLAIATFLALASNGNRAQAKQRWESLVADGIAEADLARELNLQLPTDIARRSSPAPEMKPDQPADPKPKETSQSKHLPIPTGGALLEANREFRDQYRDQVSRARSASEKGALAQELFAEAEALKDDAALGYVMQANAIELAVGQGDPAEFLKLIDAHSDAYAVDGLKLKADALEEAESAAASVDQGKALYLATAGVFASAKEMRHYEAAAQLAQTAFKCAQRAQAREAADFAEGEARRMSALHQLSSAGKKGEKTLKTSPNDPAALSAVGQMECFLNENWEAGLALLAKGSDSKLAELAQSDLESPTESSAQAKLAAAWLSYANSQREGSQRGPLLRAKHWYESAVKSAEDSAQAELKSNLEEVETLLKNEG